MVDKLRKAAEMALPLLIAYQDYTNDPRIANKCGEAIKALEAELAKPEQVQVRAQEFIAMASKSPDAVGKPVIWAEFPAKPEHPLDKKADNARELGLDYEPEQEPEICGWQFCLDGVWHDGSLFDNHRRKAGDGEYLIRNVFTLPLKHKWVGITFKDLPDEKFGNRDFRAGALWAEDKLKEKNHAH